MAVFIDRLRRHGEAASFWTLALLYIVPVWAFHFLPTQDGPSHLANAQIIKKGGHEPLFEVRADPIPNWTSHLLLAGLLYVTTPLTAEKVLVSVYILGFAGAFRYFVGAFGERRRPLSWLGLLFVYNRCFWIGFYNFCLSLDLVWLVLGYCVRHRGALDWPRCIVLLLLFLLTYFTHLAGFALAVLGALAASVIVKPRKLLGPVVVALAALPACLLTLDYFDQSGFFAQGAAQRLVRQPLGLIRGDGLEANVSAQVASMDQELFEHHAGGRYPLSWFVMALALLYVAVALVEDVYRVWLEPPLEATEVIDTDTECDDTPPVPSSPAPAGWLLPFLLGLVTLLLYLLLPNDLGARDGVLPHGGFLKTRLALLPPLLWLGCLRESAYLPVRLLVRTLVVLLLAVNLVFVWQTMARWNVVLEEYTAGIEAAGTGQRIRAVGADGGGRLVNPILHAPDYYCLGTDNVNLDNYEARTPHFPVKYRERMRPGSMQNADVMIYWRVDPRAGPRDWQEVFARGPLRICRRRAE